MTPCHIPVHISQTCNSLKMANIYIAKTCRVVYNKYKNIVQLVGSEMCVYEPAAQKMYYFDIQVTVHRDKFL